MKTLCDILVSLPQLTGCNASSFFSVSYEQDNIDTSRSTNTDSTQNQAAMLVQKAVRAYVHVLCVVSLKPTRSLGDLHLVDKAEQSAKSEKCFHVINQSIIACLLKC